MYSFYFFSLFFFLFYFWLFNCWFVILVYMYLFFGRCFSDFYFTLILVNIHLAVFLRQLHNFLVNFINFFVDYLLGQQLKKKKKHVAIGNWFTAMQRQAHTLAAISLCTHTCQRLGRHKHESKQMLQVCKCQFFHYMQASFVNIFLFIYIFV